MNDQINPRLPMRTLIRVRRLELHLTQANVAEVLRTEPEAVSNWERGERRIDLDKVPQLARILKLNETGTLQTLDCRVSRRRLRRHVPG